MFETLTSCCAVGEGWNNTNMGVDLRFFIPIRFHCPSRCSEHNLSEQAKSVEKINSTNLGKEPHAALVIRRTDVGTTKQYYISKMLLERVQGTYIILILSNNCFILMP